MYNRNFCNYIPRNNFTFQSNFLPPVSVPPPPLPPPFYIPTTPRQLDQEFVKQFNHASLKQEKFKPKAVSITEVKKQLHDLVIDLNNIKDKEKVLTENIAVLSETEWVSAVNDIEKNKNKINHSLSQINDIYLNTLRKLLAKRSAKRLRLKRVRLELKKEKLEWIKKLKERSRKIDENLQKIKDDIIQAEQEEESKLQADIVLKEVLRKKHDAKKCIVKLDALMKLRKARQNTAKGRGETVLERDETSFNNNIEKLKTLWVQKLSSYEIEESELRAKLQERTEEPGISASEKEWQTMENLAKWQEFLFGDSDATPQVDFGGDIDRFVAVRSQWDQFIEKEGSSLPVGWVLPKMT